MRNVLTILLGSFCLLIITTSSSKAQSILPLSRTIWSGTVPEGWTDGGTSSYKSSFACTDGNMGKLNSEGDFYTVSFAGTPDQLYFKLKSATLHPDCELQLSTSGDGRTYKTIAVYKLGDFKDCNEIALQLATSDRFVKFAYTKKVNNGNFGIDDVRISQKKSGNKGKTTTTTDGTL